MFQHTAARRRLALIQYVFIKNIFVSTHSRPKAAGYQPIFYRAFSKVSTHSRPKAAGQTERMPKAKRPRFQHTAARRRLGIKMGKVTATVVMFQHTAARRRLARIPCLDMCQI